jgi:hypothetical protein
MSEEEAATLNKTTISFTPSNYNIMSSDKPFKAALIVVDLQEDFCPPVSRSPPFSRARAQTRGVTHARTQNLLCAKLVL